MTLQDQVISLESGKKLRELGVEQRSIFYWELFWNGEPTLVFVPAGKIIDAGDNEYVSAFTCGELGEFIPGKFQLRITKEDEVNKWPFFQAKTEKDFWIDTEVESRALMLIHLLEQGLIKI